MPAELLTLLQNYLVIFVLLATVYYLLPAGFAYYLFFVRKRKQWAYMRIQHAYPAPGTIRREIKWSMISLMLFAGYTTALIAFIDRGYSKMYFDPGQYGYFWLVLSPVVALFIHDTFYYFMHRAMHWKPIFKYVHLLHHRSVTPTPFAIYAFQPGETVVQFAIYPVLLFLLPYHPWALGAFLLYDLAINTVGHCGFEFLPSRFAMHWYFRWQNAVTHHDQHHARANCNYGLYFNIWDRLLGTLHPEYDKRLSQSGPGNPDHVSGRAT